MFLLLFITLVSASVLSASDINESVSIDSTSDITEYDVSSSSDFDNTINTIKLSDKGKNTINLNNGSYDSFNLDVDNVDLEINGNNQIISADINMKIGPNAVVTINSLTLNHTGMYDAVITNDGTLKLNNVHITNSHPASYELSSESVIGENALDIVNDRREMLTQCSNDTYYSLSIQNNHKLFIDNSFIDGNIVNSSIVTNNYITIINNSCFMNNCADSLFTNNGKLRVTNTDIGTNYLNHLIKVTSLNTSFEPEALINNSNISYTLLDNRIVTGKYFSTVTITGCYMNDLVNPYWLYDRDWAYNIELTFSGRSMLYNNSDPRFNNIKIYDEKYMSGYQEEFNNYFNKDVPAMTVEYDAINSSIHITLYDIYSNKVDSGNVTLIVDGREVSVDDNIIINGNCNLKFGDKYLISSADKLIVTYNGNDKYSAVSQYYDNIFYSNENDYYYESDISCGLRSIPGIKSNMHISIFITNEDNHFKANDTLSLRLNTYISENNTTTDTQLPENSGIRFYLDNKQNDITEQVNLVGIDDTTKDKLYEYNIPEEITETTNHKIITEHLNPEYIKDSPEYPFYIITEDIQEEDGVNSSISITKVHQEGSNIILEGEVHVNIPDYMFTQKVRALAYFREWLSYAYIYLESSYIDYFTGTFKLVADSSYYFDQTSTETIILEYSDRLDERVIEARLNITLEVNTQTTPKTLKSYTINNETVTLNTTAIHTETNDTVNNETRKDIKNDTDTKNETKNDTNKKNEIKKDTDTRNKLIKKLYIKQENKKTVTQRNTNKNKVYNNAKKDTLTIETGFNITLSWLNKIFSKDFHNQNIQIYIDDELIYNSTADDEIYRVLFTITNKYLGEHTIKVVSNNMTYTQKIVITP